MPLFLALDQSTSATKALLFDAAGQVLDRESLEHRQLYPQPGWVEHDAAEIWRNTLAAARALLARHPGRTGELAALSLTNQRETVVVFVEVRYRQHAGYGGGAASIDRNKRRRLVRAALLFLARHRALADAPCRFDVVEASGDPDAPSLTWLRDAFRADDA